MTIKFWKKMQTSQPELTEEDLEFQPVTPTTFEKYLVSSFTPTSATKRKRGEMIIYEYFDLHVKIEVDPNELVEYIKEQITPIVNRSIEEVSSTQSKKRKLNDEFQELLDQKEQSRIIVRMLNIVGLFEYKNRIEELENLIEEERRKHKETQIKLENEQRKCKKLETLVKPVCIFW